jgi:arginase family enzyme
LSVATQLAQHVRSAIRDGEFPLVLAGDCNSCLGTVAGCEDEGLGVVWFDAHADIDAPENTPSTPLRGSPTTTTRLAGSAAPALPRRSPRRSGSSMSRRRPSRLMTPGADRDGRMLDTAVRTIGVVANRAVGVPTGE